MKLKHAASIAAVGATIFLGTASQATSASAATFYGSYHGSTPAKCAAATAAGLGYEAAQGSKVTIISYCRYTTGVGYVTKVRVTI